MVLQTSKTAATPRGPQETKMVETLATAKSAIMQRAGRPMFVILAFGIAVLFIWTLSVQTASADSHGEAPANAPVDAPPADDPPPE